MNCERAQPLISALIDGEVSAAERERVLAHVRDCPACAGLYDDYRRLRAQVRGLATVAPPADLGPATWRRIAAEGRAPHRWRGRFRAIAGGAVAVAAALLVAVPLSSGSDGGIERLAALMGRAPSAATVTPEPQRQVFELASLASPTPPPAATATATPAASPTAPATRVPILIVPEPARPTVTPESAPDVTGSDTTATPVRSAPSTPTPRPAVATPRPATATQPPRPASSPSAAVTATPRGALATSTRPPATATRSPSTATVTPPPTRPPATPTRMPATATPAATATRPPAPVTGSSFAAALAANAVARERLGSPLAAERAVDGLTQGFERGLMESFADARQIIVLYRDGHSWVRFADTWSPDEVTPTGEPPPAGLHRPRRGFGKLWRENPTVRERLGWATGPDIAYAARVQRFERGQLVKSNGAIFALFEDGAWERID